MRVRMCTRVVTIFVIVVVIKFFFEFMKKWNKIKNILFQTQKMQQNLILVYEWKIKVKRRKNFSFATFARK